MFHFLLALHFVLTMLIIGLIMLQKHDSDGALGSSGGGAASGMFSVRGQANILTKSTAVLMAVFMINCLIMAKITKRTNVSETLVADTVPSSSSPPLAKTELAPVAPAAVGAPIVPIENAAADVQGAPSTVQVPASEKQNG